MSKSIKHFVQHLFADQDNWKIQLLQQWPSILGSLSNKVQLEKINEDSLVLGVTDSCWLQEMYMLSPLLLQTINKKLDGRHIKHLRFKKVGIKKQTKRKTTPKKHTTPRKLHLSSKQEGALQSVKDPALRTAITNFLSRCQQENE